MSAIQSFQENLQTWGYLLLFLYSFGGGYVAIIAAGFLSGMGKMDISLCIGLAFLGNAIGSSVLAWLVRRQKQDFMGYLKKHQRKVALCFIWLKRYGTGLIFFSKYVYGVKTIVPIAIGMSKYSLKRFFVFNAAASLVWALAIGLLSFFASELVVAVFEKFSHLPSYSMPVVMVALGALLLFALKFFSQKR